MASVSYAVECRETSAVGHDPVRRYELVILLLVMMPVLCLQLRTAFLRPFWFDELFTFLVSSRSSLNEMFRAIPLDGNPPLYFILARLCLHQRNDG